MDKNNSRQQSKIEKGRVQLKEGEKERERRPDKGRVGRRGRKERGNTTTGNEKKQYKEGDE